MKKKIAWLVVSCLMVAALVLASCAPKAVEEKEVVTPKEEVVTPKEEAKKEEAVVKEEVMVPAAEVPKYGGVFTLAYPSSPAAFDECFTTSSPPNSLTNENVLGYNWVMGPAGTGESTWKYIISMFPEYMQFMLAENWEMPDADTMVWHIRKGVYWQDKPPVNGREMTAYDVVFTWNYLWDSKKCPKSFNQYFPYDTHIESITATDKWTVVVKSKPGTAPRIYEIFGCCATVMPPEVINKYGDMNDWRNVVGTGPFILKDYVADSSWSMVRNPNYWMKDPVGPGKGNQLPYLDGVKAVIIPDVSTRMAALRTAKVDRLTDVTWEDAERFWKTDPQLKWASYLASPQRIYMRVDNPKLPFYDKRVRHALALAVNQPEMADAYYRGYAEIVDWPGANLPEVSRFYTPLDGLPQSTRELYEYHPDKAKQLLAEAGYPNGFKTQIVALPAEVDLLSIVKAYWADIGVDLLIDVKESAVKSSIGYLKSHKEMYMGSIEGLAQPISFASMRTGYIINYSMIDDARVMETYWDIYNNYFNMDRLVQEVKDLVPYVLDQAWWVQLPAPYRYVFWQPWVKNYHGELQLNVFDHDFPRYMWLDQDLKEKMTGRR